METRLSCLLLLSCAFGCCSAIGLGWHAGSSVILRGLGLNPLFSFNVRGSVSIEDNVGLENINLIEGDIIPDEHSDGSHSVVALAKRLWPKGRIPYTISSKLNDHKDDIRSAMKYLQNVTCLRFVRRTVESNYLRIFKGEGCNSKVGMVGNGAQDVSLGSGCYKRGKIVHELLHAAGFYHEQSRSDRDDYINIHWENIMEGHEKNFVKRQPDAEQLLTSYDYKSIMHYGSYTFSKDKSRGLKTMTAKKEGVILESPGVKVLTAKDIKRVSILYNCTLPRSSFSFY